MVIPDDIVILDQPGEQIFMYPDWARWVIVTVRGADGGTGSDGQPGGQGQSTSFAHQINEKTVRVLLGLPGRDFDGVRRNPGAYAILELFA